MATTIDQKHFVKTALRMPPEMHAAVHESAQKNGRSYNAELVALIERGMKVPEGFISAPRAVLSAAEDGSYRMSTPGELIIELSDKLRSASLLAELFRSYQDGTATESVDFSSQPEWVEPAEDAPAQREPGAKP